MDPEDQSFSVFKYCDDRTSSLISKLGQLAKSRIYKVEERSFQDLESSEKASPRRSSTSKPKSKKK